MKKIINIILWMGLVLLYLALNSGFGELIKYLDIKNIYLKNTLLLVCEIIITVILIALYKKDFKKDYKDIHENDKEKIYNTIKIWAIGLTIMLFSNVIINNIVGSIASNESSNRELIGNAALYAIPTMIIFTPICEEIIFRLSISKIIDNKYIFMLISGLLFGYAHVLGETGLELLYIIPYGSLGAAFGYLYKKYDNIICSIIAHILHNLLCITIIILL